jgi:hypothetical protein
MDPYYAMGVCCWKKLFICRVSIGLYSNIIMKFITNSYDFKNKKHGNKKGIEYKSIKVLILQYTGCRLADVLRCCAALTVMCRCAGGVLILFSACCLVALIY